MSNLPTLQHGDLVFATSIKAHYFADDGSTLQLSFSAGKKRKFMFLLLGGIEAGKETTVDLDELLKLNGLQRIPE